MLSSSQKYILDLLDIDVYSPRSAFVTDEDIQQESAHHEHTHDESTSEHSQNQQSPPSRQNEAANSALLDTLKAQISNAPVIKDDAPKAKQKPRKPLDVKDSHADNPLSDNKANAVPSSIANEANNVTLQTSDHLVKKVLENTQVTSLDQAEQRVRHCQNCDLHQQRTQTVFGSGLITADLMIIGDIPQHEDDIQGKPFVSKQGQVIDLMLKSIGLERTQVYLCNVIKCRPPNSRAAQQKELESCFNHLSDQIKLVKPLIIFALGESTNQLLLKQKQSLESFRGQVHVLPMDENINVLSSHHPRELFVNGLTKQQAWQDLKQLKKILDDNSNT